MIKKIFVFLLFSVLTGAVIFSQAPESFSYQAIVRNDKGEAIENRAVSFRFRILVGSSSGQIVYGERHDVMTDDYGFIALAIGNGTVLAGAFETIEWGDNSHYLNVAIDTLGGSSFTDMGTTRFLSVPYALYAKNGFSGDYNDLSNIPVTDGSETVLTAGDNIAITGNGTTDNPYLVNTMTHTVGEHYGGGIVFYVSDNGQHGLIAAPVDQDHSIEWYNGRRRYTNSGGDGIESGEMNTALIIALQTNDNPMSNFAAKVCADYSVIENGVMFGDWYLPSKYELGLMFFNKDIIGGFSNSYYWSSSEFSSITAWSQDFSTGVQYNLNKSMPYGVRAIRAF